MKKLLLFAVGAAMAATASSQVMTSYSYSKSERKTLWYARLGVSFNNLTAGSVCEAMNSPWLEDNGETPYSFGSKTGMTVDFGFQRPISNFGLYWGMELGIGTRGFTMKYDESEVDPDDDFETNAKMMTWNVKYSPFTFGYKYTLTDDIKLDAHIGAFVSYDFAGKKLSYEETDGDKWELKDDELKDALDYQDFDAGMQLGIGVWYKRFNLDFTWQRCFVPYGKMTMRAWDSYGESLGTEEYSLYSSNFMIRLGVAF